MIHVNVQCLKAKTKADDKMQTKWMGSINKYKDIDKLTFDKVQSQTKKSKELQKKKSLKSTSTPKTEGKWTHGKREPK